MRQQGSLPQQRRHLKGIRERRLWLQVIVATVLGVAFGALVGPTSGLLSPEVSALIANWVSLPGKLFLLAIQFVVIPLVVASVIGGIAAQDTSDGLGNLGALGLRTVGFFLFTTVLAVGIGLGVAGAIQPGRYMDGSIVAAARNDAGGVSTAPSPAATALGAEQVPDLIVNLFPRDPLGAFVGGDMLQIVVAAIILGIALVLTPGDQRKPILDLLASIQAACMVIVGWALRFTPVAVFALLANIASRMGLSVLLGAGMYMVAVVAGLGLLFLAYLVLVRLLARRPAFGFLAASREVILLAFSTSSSAAVMPLTLARTEDTLKVHPQIARFVVPLGTTINMGGTAVYQGVATLFLAQVFEVDIGLTGLLLVVVMATGAAVGTPGTPGVGIVILATILGSVGIPADGIALILGVDRLLDMGRTAVNVTGDMVACVVLDRSLGGNMRNA